MRFHHVTLSPGFSATFSGVPSSTRATFPRQVTHVPCKTKLFPWTSPVKSVMVVMSPQWGHQTFCKIRSWKCEGIASQSICAAGVNGGGIGWRPLERTMIRVHHDLGYTVSSMTGGTAHVTLSQYSNAYHRGMRFDERNRGRVCGPGAAL